MGVLRFYLLELGLEVNVNGHYCTKSRQRSAKVTLQYIPVFFKRIKREEGESDFDFYPLTSE